MGSRRSHRCALLRHEQGGRRGVHPHGQAVPGAEQGFGWAYLRVGVAPLEDQGDAGRAAVRHHPHARAVFELRMRRDAESVERREYSHVPRLPRLSGHGPGGSAHSAALFQDASWPYRRLAAGQGVHQRLLRERLQDYSQRGEDRFSTGRGWSRSLTCRTA